MTGHIHGDIQILSQQTLFNSKCDIPKYIKTEIMVNFDLKTLISAHFQGKL